MIAGVIVLLALFLACAVLALGWAGVRTISTVVLSGLLIAWLIPAAALRGVPVLWLALPSAVVIAAGGILLIGGWNRKSFAAALGAALSLLLAAALPLALAGSLHLTGLDVHVGPQPHPGTRLWLDPEFGRVDLADVLLAAVVLASLGAVMDVSMVIASSVEQLPAAGWRLANAFRSGARVGARVLGPMLATMALALFGADLAFNVVRATGPWCPRGSLELLNYECFAAQALQLLAAGLGLLCCIPLTALFAAALRRRNEPR